MATIASQSVDTGNTVYLMMKTTPIGRAQSFSAERSFGTEGVYEVGSIMPQEHVFLKFTGTVQLERYRMRYQSLATLGFAALGEEVLNVDLVDIVTLDNLTNEVKIAYRGCSIDNYSESYKANDIVTESSKFYFLTSTAVQGAANVAQGNNVGLTNTGIHK